MYRIEEKTMPRADAIAARPKAFPVITHAKVDADGLSRLLLAYTSRSIEAGKIFHHEAGETFLHEGESATHFFTVAEGTVKLFKMLFDNRRAVIGFLFPGDLCGFSDAVKYNFNAKALTPVRLCSFPRSELKRMYLDYPGLESQLLELVTRELAATQDQMMLLGRMTAPERVASFLLMLARRQSWPGDWIELAMSRADIADYLGLSTETVSRVLTALKASGCVVLAPNKVRIADADALTQLAEGVGSDDD
ncbi:MAG: Crp/Fnr family transcriptional regulator [Stellaceae bacterium]